MPFTVSPVLFDDIPQLSDIQWAALNPNPLIWTLYPYGTTPDLCAFTTDSYNKAIQFPSVRLMKATDTETSEVVAFAKWIVYPGEMEEEGSESQNKEAKQGGGWSKGGRQHMPSDCDEMALKDWTAIIARKRKSIMQERNHSCGSRSGCSLQCYFSCFAPALWVLDILHTHPLHQGRGAGAQLIKWGTDLADHQGLQCYLESSPAAYSLAKQCDFEDITDIEIDLSKYNEGYEDYKHVVMIRPPKIAPRVPSKDNPNHVVGEWDFGLAEEFSNG